MLQRDDPPIMANSSSKEKVLATKIGHLSVLRVVAPVGERGPSWSEGAADSRALVISALHVAYVRPVRLEQRQPSESALDYVD